VSHQPAYPVFCFEGKKVPYPASGFLPDIKLSWRTSHYYQYGRVEVISPLTAAIGRLFFGQKSPAPRARELFKPSTDSANLRVEIEKKFFSFSVWRFLEVTSQ